MKITWLGHSGFRIEIEDVVLLVDPWLNGNPSFPAERRSDALEGVTHILLSHGHGDHASDVLPIVQETGAPVAAIHELASLLGAEGVQTIGFNMGGTISLGAVKVTMVRASHSSSVDFKGAAPVYAGEPAGFMIAGEGKTIYFTGDTDVMADMAIYQDLHAPNIGILSCGGLYTMDMKRAAYAARKFFSFEMIIPCHYRTFPALAQNAEELRAGLAPGARVIEPEVLQAITI